MKFMQSRNEPQNDIHDELARLGGPATDLLPESVMNGGMPELPRDLLCLDDPPLDWPGMVTRWEEWR